MKHVYIILFILLLMGGQQSCITPFTPEGLDTSGGTLVVEGDIWANDTTMIFLSYSLALDDDNIVIFETNALVWVESETGIQYVGELKTPNSKRPYFAINTTNLDLAMKYKLCIYMQGENYASDLMPILVTPPIDSVNYIVNATQSEVTFYVNTHGTGNNSRYYKWQYQEDWEFTSSFYTRHYYDYAADTILPLPNDINTFYCWDNSYSTDILITQTDGLVENIVYQMPLTSFTHTDLRANYLYSILVHQFSLSQEAYRYWATLKKNSDELYGIFAPQPTEISGNIHCFSDPNKKVLGYVNISTVASKRIFVSANDLKIYRAPNYCTLFDPENGEWPSFRRLYIMGYRVIPRDLEDTYFDWVPESCVDCRALGTKNKPSFWPNNDQ